MSAPTKSAQLRKLWADPEWAAKTRAAQSAGQHRRWSTNPTWASEEPPANARFKDKRAVTSYIDAESFAELRQQAIKRRVSLGELVRTYVEWGLEAEGQA